MTQITTVLGLESSCDDTAAAVVRQDGHTQAEILSSIVFSQNDLHKPFGGVVPELAARAHAEKLDQCVRDALEAASTTLENIDAIAVTAGPGLIGGVMSGVMFAKGLSAATGVPLMGINHLAGHALTPRLTDAVDFPYLMLLVSGGHCQYLLVHDIDRFTRLGGTIDDAPGEAFDKTARLLGLDQPGGPAVQKEAQLGDPSRFRFPRPMLDRDDCNLSFSGLKTAVLRQRDQIVTEKGGITRQDRSDICAGFQLAVSDVLRAKTKRALNLYLLEGPVHPVLAVAGGVAANTLIRSTLKQVSEEAGVTFIAPPLALCTDNAAMIAYAGIEKFRSAGQGENAIVARPRWPLDQNSPALLGSGRKGAKA